MPQISDGGGGTIPVVQEPQAVNNDAFLAELQAIRRAQQQAASGATPSPAGSSAGGILGALRLLLRSWGLPLGLAGSLVNAMRTGGEAAAIDQLYGSGAFRARFAGIFAKDGSLIMSPPEYLRYERQTTNLAARYGITLSKQDIAKAVQSELDPKELDFRFRGAQALTTNAQVYGAFNEYRKARGQKPLTKSELYKFAINAAPQHLYDSYEEAFALSAAKGAGLNVRLDQIRRDVLQSSDVTGLEEYQQKYGRIAQQLREAGPELAGMGITQEDLRIIEFGGENRALRLARAEQALKNRQAALEGQRAQQRIGLAGSAPVTGYQQAPGL